MASEAMLGVAWRAMFVPDTPVLEIVVRGSIMYLAIFALFRTITRREAGALGITDLLVLVLVADAAQNAMSGDYRSIADGLILVLTILVWSWLMAWLAYRFPIASRLLRARAVPLVKNGRINRRSLRRELITEGELRSAIRLEGVEDIADVKEAFVEPDGRISVISAKDGSRGAPDRESV